MAAAPPVTPSVVVNVRAVTESLTGPSAHGRSTPAATQSRHQDHSRVASQRRPEPGTGVDHHGRGYRWRGYRWRDGAVEGKDVEPVAGTAGLGGRTRAWHVAIGKGSGRRDAANGISAVALLRPLHPGNRIAFSLAEGDARRLRHCHRIGIEGTRQTTVGDAVTVRPAR
jgi:hypothetical protein